MSYFDTDEVLALITAGDLDVAAEAMAGLDVTDCLDDNGAIREVVEAYETATPNPFINPYQVHVISGEQSHGSNEVVQYLKRVAATFQLRADTIGHDAAMALEISDGLEVINPYAAGYNASGDFPGAGKWEAALLVTYGGPNVHILASSRSMSNPEDSSVMFHGTWGTDTATVSLRSIDASYLVQSAELIESV